jgi:hypothetical protein
MNIPSLILTISMGLVKKIKMKKKNIWAKMMTMQSRVLVAVTNEILKRESSKCNLDPPRVERRGTRIVTLG